MLSQCARAQCQLPRPALCHRTPFDTWGPACILGDTAVSYLDIQLEQNNTLNQLLLATFTIA